jgi:hypothetical protein
VSFKSRNSIQNLFMNLGQGEQREQQEKYIKEAEEYANEELRNYVKLKCLDLRYFIMKHFEAEFNNEGEVPRQWNVLAEEDINKLYVKVSICRLNLRRNTSRWWKISGSLELRRA